MQSIRAFLRNQFGRPTGLWGHVAGRIMAGRPSNLDRIRWTISLLGIQPRDRVLEIGFGPGIAVELASKLATQGFIAGVDHSEVMVRQAGKRNATAVRNGKVALLHGSVSDLPAFQEPFDKIFTINSVHFWNDPINRFRDLRQLLKPGGLIAVTIQPRSRGATDESANRVGEELAADLERAGFSRTRLEMHQAKPVAVACALGVR